METEMCVLGNCTAKLQGSKVALFSAHLPGGIIPIIGAIPCSHFGFMSCLIKTAIGMQM